MNPQIPLSKQSLSGTTYRFPNDRSAMEKLKNMLSLANDAQETRYHKVAKTLPSTLPSADVLKNNATSILAKLLEEFSKLFHRSRHTLGVLYQRALGMKFIEDILKSLPSSSMQVRRLLFKLFITLKAISNMAVGYMGDSYKYLFSTQLLLDARRGLRQCGLNVGDAICHKGLSACNAVIEWFMFGRDHYKGIFVTAALLYNFDSVLLLMLLAFGRLKRKSGVLATSIYQSYNLEGFVPPTRNWLQQRVTDRKERKRSVTVPKQQNMKWTLFKFAMLWVSAQFVYYRFIQFLVRLVSQPKLQLLLGR